MASESIAGKLVNIPSDADQFIGNWSTYDVTNRAFIGNQVHMWVTDTECGMSVSDASGGPSEAVRFERKQIIWAFTCMMRLMRRKGSLDYL